MRKYILAASLLLGLSFLPAQAESLCSRYQIRDEIFETCLIGTITPSVSQTATLTVTATTPPTITPSQTAITQIVTRTATSTRMATIVPTVTKTATLTETMIIPTVSGHDTTRWHALTNHEHGDNPNAAEIVAIFGTAGETWNGVGNANIGVPFGTSPIENTTKHAFAKYYTMTAAQLDAGGYPCGVGNVTDNGGAGVNCIRGWRILMHGGATVMEALANNHSVFAEVLVCNVNDQTQCGIIRSGGWLFWGKLQAPFYNAVHERLGAVGVDIGGHVMTFSSDATDLAAIGSPNTVFDNWGGEPYWFMFPRTMPDGFDALTFARNNPTANLGDQISSNEVGASSLPDCAPFPVGAMCGNRIIHLAARFWDGWNLADTNNLYNPVFICTQLAPSNCNFNGSKRGMKEVMVYINPAWDGVAFDTDARTGYVSMSQYTDRYQRLRPVGACAAISVDCVPLVLEGMPVGYAGLQLQVGVYQPFTDREYDCPQGGCISFPN